MCNDPGNSENVMPADSETPWPIHADGRPKKMGEMTADERKAQFAGACAKVKSTMEAPAMKQAMREFMNGTADAEPKH